MTDKPESGNSKESRGRSVSRLPSVVPDISAAKKTNGSIKDSAGDNPVRQKPVNSLPIPAPPRKSQSPLQGASATKKKDAFKWLAASDEVAPTQTPKQKFDLFSDQSVPIDPDLFHTALQEASNPDSDDETAEAITIRQSIKRHRHPLSSFCVSLLAHSVLFLLAMLFIFQSPQPERKIGLIAEITANPVPDNPSDVSLETVEIEIPDDSQSPIEMAFQDTANQEVREVAESVEATVNAIAEELTPAVSESVAPVAAVLTRPTGGGLAGRDASARSRMAASRGGSEASEMAVEQGLQWIINHQHKDGSWRFKIHKGECNGRCRDHGLAESETAATGLALMSLLGAGYTHRVGPYQKPIDQGLKYLQKSLHHSDLGGNLTTGYKKMYSQAIATIALAEAYAMTRDPELADSVEDARKFILSAQHANGSWGYDPGQPGDITVTGWQLMALKSCELAGYPSDMAVWDAAEGFIDKLASSNGQFGYRTPQESRGTTTSVGLLMKMYLGMPKEHQTLEQGTVTVSDEGPSQTNVYYNYYATQVLNHMGGANWKTWNQEMRDYLIVTQDSSGSHQSGSWYFPDKNSRYGGRLYTTAMCVMTLEVYYRFMPLYDDGILQSLDDPTTEARKAASDRY